MALDAQAQKLLDLMAESGGPPLTSMSPEEARALPGVLAQLSGPGPEVASVRDIEIPGPGGRLRARVYEPVADPPGTVVFFHGGGWVIGRLDEFDATMRILANESGTRVVNVDYRLAPEHPYPAAVEDAYAATKWVASELAGGRPLVVAGDSAGGNLATVTALRAREEGPEIAMQVLIYPGVDMDTTTEHMQKYRDTHFLLNQPECDWFFDHYVPNAADRTKPDVAPLRADSLGGLPPTYLVVAGHDPLLEQCLHYGQRLEEAGVPVQLVRYDDQMHAFFTLPNLIDAANRAIADAGAAIKAAIS